MRGECEKGGGIGEAIDELMTLTCLCVCIFGNKILYIHTCDIEGEDYEVVVVTGERRNALEDS